MIRFLPLLWVAVSYAQPGKFIHIDQFGYLSPAEKVAVLSDPQTGFNAADSYQPGMSLELRNLNTDAIVFSASPMVWNAESTHGQSGDRGWWFDFSGYTTVGTYYINDPTTGEKSAPFEINDNPYADVLRAALKMFYYNRCNDSKQPPFAAAGWTDATNFMNPLQDAHCRYVNDRQNISLEKNLTGGWFDAGDYNKYVTFAHSPVHDLLSSYEEHPAIFTDDWNLPESGNGLPDILDELKWELDWLMKMSNPDGSVQIKMGSIDFADNVEAPPSANTDQRFYGPVCSSASIAIASMFAHAAKVFQDQPGMQTFAGTLQSRAIACWNAFFTLFDTDMLDFNCDDGTIKAGDADWSEAVQKEVAITAAIYLFELTGLAVYHNFVVDHYDEVETVAAPFWGPYKIPLIEALLLYTTLPGNNASVTSTIRNSAVTDINNNYSNFFAFSPNDLYRAEAPDWMYHWGSNMPKAQVGNLCRILIKYNVLSSANASLKEKADEQLHYFHGVNPMGLVYLSNMYALGGDRCVDQIYHTWFYDGTPWDHALDSPFGPAPGFMSGGPNKDFSVGSISPPSGQPPQKSYLDFNTGYPDNSWEITEPAIYYQAAYIRFLANYVNTHTVTSTVNLQLANDCIEIYPNPTGSFFHLKGILDKYQLEIYDSMGNLHQTIANLGSEAVVDMSALPSGTFLIRVENLQNNLLCVQKILKQ